MLDDHHGVPDILEPLQRRDEPIVVALVQADRGLVEDVEHANELRTDLRREPEALCLAARERRSGTVEREVADTDVFEEREALANLLEDPHGDLLVAITESQLVEKLDGARDRESSQLVNVLPANRDRENLCAQPRTLTLRARARRHVLLDALARLGRVGLTVAALEVRDDALELHGV